MNPLPQLGELVAEKYRVVRVVADGGMGIVFEAHHELLGKGVALKFPLPELAHVPSISERFLAEARLCARIENEHVVRVLDVSKFDGLPFIVMELVSGVSLAKQLGTPWAAGKAAAFARQILEGLDAVHALGVVHRDVKPDNVLVVESARGPILKLIDFGIAKDSLDQAGLQRLTRVGAMLGTPAYMAPEQVHDSAHAGFRADLYSVGVVLFEMLSGSSPFTGSSAEEVALQVASGQLRGLRELVPGVAPALEAVVARATAVDPTLRFDSARAFMHALAPFADTSAARAPVTEYGGPATAYSAPVTEYATPAPVTEYGGPATAYATPAPAPVTEYGGPPGAASLARWRELRPTNPLRSLAIGALVVLSLAILSLLVVALRRHSPVDVRTASLLPSAPAEVDIAPLASESADPSAAVFAPRRTASGANTASVTPRAPSPAAVSEAIQANSAGFSRCETSQEGSTVAIDVHVADDGSVSRVTPVSSTASPEATECVAAEAQSLRFPPHPGAEEVARVEVPLAAAPEPERRPRRLPQHLGRGRRQHQRFE